MSPRVLLSTCCLCAFVACSSSQSDPPGPGSTPNGTLFTDAIIDTMDPGKPTAQAVGVVDGRIVAVGSETEVRAVLVNPAQTIALKGQYVLPGLIDSHTHPGIIAVTTTLEPPGSVSLPGTFDPAVLFSWLQQYANANPQLPFFNILGNWDDSLFIPGGPTRQSLDAIFPDTATILEATSGHSYWLNSKALNMLGVTSSRPDLSPNLSVFVRDQNGDPTGWVKEWALMREMTPVLFWDTNGLRNGLKSFLDYLSAHGVTTLYDGGNFDGSDKIYGILKELDDQHQLPIRYEGTYHIYRPDQLDTAVSELLRLKSAYEGAMLKINTVKIHYDGVNEDATAAQLEPFTNNQGTGGELFTPQQVASLILLLDANGINLHLHTIGERAVRDALDAVQMALATKGGPLNIQVTLAHLENVTLEDIPRFKALGVNANFTPHWLLTPAYYYGPASEINLGEPRASNRYLIKTFMESGANVTFSSDVTDYASETNRSNPFVGIQMGMTRRDYTLGPADPAVAPADEAVDLDSMLKGYTVDGAQQLGMSADVGAIAVGKYADMIVLPSDPHTVNPYQIHDIVPTAVLLGGAVVQGALTY